MRFRTRHVHKTICDFLETQMTARGWVNVPINFGASPLTFMEIQPDENGEEVLPNLLAITIGDVPEDNLEQLGSGIWSVPIPVFFDIYGDNGSVAVSIADDVKDLVSRNMAISVYDWTDPNNPVEQSDYIDFERVVGPERPAASIGSSDFRKHWRVVKGIARVYYSAD